MDLLLLLVSRRGRLVPRADIVRCLWGDDVFVDVETGVNTAIRKVRQALSDSADAPRFVETVPGRGYRFIADVASVPVAATGATAPLSAPVEEPRETATVSKTRPPVALDQARLARHLAIVAGAMLVAGLVLWNMRPHPPPVVAGRTIAVLPFEGLSADPEHAYLADGLTEDTIASLGRLDPDRLRVLARASTLPYRGTTRSAADIGRELQADYLVSGSIRSESGRFRVTSTLIRVGDQVQVWSASYDREPASLLEMQQDLSTAIAGQIELRLNAGRFDTLAARHTRNADAYDLYLRGRNFALQRTQATTRRAIEYYQQAIAIDPDYGLAWSGIAQALTASQLNGDAPPDVCRPAAHAAGQAVHVAPDLPEARLALGHVQWTCAWDWPAAEAGLREVVGLAPHDALAHVLLGHVLSQVGRHHEALALTQRARELDPLEPTIHALSSQIAFQARHFATALNVANRAIALDPELWIAHVMRAQALEQQGQLDAAIDAASTAARFSGMNSKTLAIRGHALARAGRPDEARQVLAALREAARVRYVPPYASALVHAGLGEVDVALDWLERALAVRDVHLIFLTADPKWDVVRGHPRFEAILDRSGFRG